MRARGRVLAAIAALAVILVAGGGVLLVADANERVTRAVALVAELDEYYESDEAAGYDPGPAAPRIRAALTESVVNDGPMPELFTGEGEGYFDARYGAFGGLFSYSVVSRPWSPRLLTVPIAVGAVLAITVVLLRAAAWTPRPARSVQNGPETH